MIGIILGHLAAARLRIEVTAFALHDAVAAHRAIEQRQTTGKVVLKP